MSTHRIRQARCTPFTCDRGGNREKERRERERWPGIVRATSVSHPTSWGADVVFVVLVSTSVQLVVSCTHVIGVARCLRSGFNVAGLIFKHAPFGRRARTDNGSVCHQELGLRVARVFCTLVFDTASLAFWCQKRKLCRHAIRKHDNGLPSSTTQCAADSDFLSLLSVLSSRSP